MKSRQPLKSAVLPKSGALNLRIKESRNQAEQTDKTARTAKAAYKKARQDFKAAKKAAKKARKELKALLRHLKKIRGPRPVVKKAVKRKLVTGMKVPTAASSPVMISPLSEVTVPPAASS